MSLAAVAAAALVVAWAALVIAAQLLNPEQSPLSMGMSGLARGRAPWVMKSAFLCRGASALVLLIAVPGALGTTGITLAGIVAFWIWGVGSAALAVIDTDMPGEPPSRAGAAHALLALVAYVAGVAGAMLLSLELLGRGDTGGLAVWALALALAAAAAMMAQFVAFGAAAREARVAASSASVTPAAAMAPAAAMGPATAVAPATTPPPLAAIPPQLATAGPAHATGQAARRADGAPVSLSDLPGYAGLLQRVFVGLLMAWTLLVALGID
jgi:Protein of unknown function (DUF998)